MRSSPTRVRRRAAGRRGTGPLRLDATDRLILDMLQENARVSNVDIARRAGMAPSGILERLRKLEERNVIVRYETRLDPAALGLGLTAFVFVKANDRGRSKAAAQLAAFPAVQEIHNVAGEDCYLVKIRTSTPQALGHILRKFAAIPSVSATRTTIVLETLKERIAMPLSDSDDATASNETRESNSRPD